MRRNPLITCASVVLGVLGPVRPASGYPVTWEFAGEITSVRDDDGLLGEAVPVGSPFSGSYTFESTTEPTSPGGGFYDDALITASGTVGEVGFVGFVGFSNFLLVANVEPGSGSDHYQVLTPVELLGEVAGFWLTLEDSTGTVFSSNALPVSPPRLEYFDPSEFRLSANSEAFVVTGEITALVPEPGTLLLLLLGALVMRNRQRVR